ncbi:hypothetical protein PO909_026445 [Leuciscus waleckii]
MANLLSSRVLPDEPPFTRIGIDCSSPFEIKRGRSTVKRYGVIFTCLAIRAIHVKVVASVDTDSFIHALRRFIARRGKVLELRSDNGTNFVGAERELREAIKKWNHDKISDVQIQKSIKWIFNPPTGYHHGGVWERMIRSVRKIMNSILRGFQVGDVVLVVNDAAPRNSWIMGKIVHTIPDKRGFLRQVRIKTRYNCLDRPVTKICLLLEAEEDYN